MNNSESWKITTNYPLLATSNTERAGELIIAHLANGCDDQLLIKLVDCQFICFVNYEPMRPHTYTNIGLIAYNNICMQFISYSLEECYKKDYIFNAKAWSVSKTDLPSKFKCLIDLKDQIMSAKVIE